jgi:2-polyprenyl-6-methoxyphenol hydroxylase-like FAD-dependent oxidoreductase
MREVLIVGGGIAGSVAGKALREAGFAVTVCEAHRTGADEVGSWLVLQANGIDALAAIGAHHDITRTGFPTRTMRFVNGRGRVLGVLTNGNPLPDGTRASWSAAPPSTRPCATKRQPVVSTFATAPGSSTPTPKRTAA